MHPTVRRLHTSWVRQPGDAPWYTVDIFSRNRNYILISKNFPTITAAFAFVRAARASMRGIRQIFVVHNHFGYLDRTAFVGPFRPPRGFYMQKAVAV